MKILVTGIAGFIGFHVARRFLKRGDAILGIDSINSYYDQKLKYDRLSELGISDAAAQWGVEITSQRYPSLIFIRMRLEDRSSIERLFDKESFDCVINLAAQAGVRYSIDHPYEYIDSNIVGFINILEACRHSKVKHLVYASSSSVYGLNGQHPFSIYDNTDQPVSLYAATKKSNELMAHVYSSLYNLSTTGLRFFTVYGPWGRPDMAYFKFAKLIIENSPIDIYNNGDMWRDFTYIDDIVEAVLRVCENFPYTMGEITKNSDNAREMPYRVYNVGNSKPVKLTSFIEIFENILGKKATKNYLPMQPGDVYATEADILDMKRDFDWTPATDLKKGITYFCDWYKRYYRIDSI